MTKVAMLLAMYVLVLAMVPCADEGICTSATDLAITEGHNHDSDTHESEQHQDSCTPLCVCSCCGIITNFHHSDEFVFKTSETYRPFKIQQITLRFHGYSHSVWQPPKIEIYA